MPTAVTLERRQPLDRRSRHHRQRDALKDIRRLAVPGRQQRRAHRTRPLALRAEHVAVDDKGILGSEQIGKRRRSALALEGIILFDLAARRQPAPLLRDALDMAAKLDLLGQQRLPGAAIFGALVGKTEVTGARQFGGGFQSGTAHVMTSAQRISIAPTGRRSSPRRSDKISGNYFSPS